MTRLRLCIFALLAVAGATIVVAGCAIATNSGSGSKSVHATSGKSVDLSKLPLGDGKVTTTGAKRGYVYRCGTGGGGGGGAGTDGPWINGKTYDLTSKATVSGSVNWDDAKVTFKKASGKRKVNGNGLPVGTITGVFPVQTGDDAYKYDRNPNSIKTQTVKYTLTSTPKKASKATCLGGGPIGIAKNGVAIYDGLDAQSRDAVAHEVQDDCGGHPQMSGQYHYHSLSPCLFKNEPTNKASGLFGYALDGFPIYGPRGAGGKIITNDDLDVCHGRSETVKVGNKSVRKYVYHATYEFPYTLGCYSGTPAAGTQGGGGGGEPQGGPPQGPPAF